MASLADALRTAKVLPGLPVPGWVGRLLDLAQTPPLPPSPPIDVSQYLALDAGPFHADLLVGIVGAQDHLRLTVELAGCTLTWGAGGAAVSGAGDGRVVIEVDDAGHVTLTPEGDLALAVAGGELASFPLPGDARLTITLDQASLVVDADPDSGIEPHLALGASLALTGLPLPDGLVPAVPVWLTWGPSGLDGGVGPAPAYSIDDDGDHGTDDLTFAAGDDVTWEVGWAGDHDWRPASLLVDLPLTALPGLDQVLHGRMRLIAARGGGQVVTARVELVGGDDGLAATGDTTSATAAVLLAATATAPSTVPEADGLVGVAAVVATAGALAHALGAHDGKARVDRASFLLERPTRVVLDYQAEVAAKAAAGPVAVATTAPMRAVVRDLAVEWAGSVPRLDWSSAKVDVADPGQWRVTKPSDGPLLVDTVRTGSGSMWFEVDLRFALDLGPVEVDGATVRVTLPTGKTEPGDLQVAVRGFGVRLTVPGLVEASGSFAFTGGDGHTDPSLQAALQATLPSLGLAAAASLRLEPQPGGWTSMVADLGVDLPSPIPLAGTGLGLFGVRGTVGLNRDAAFPDTFQGRLDWDPVRGSRPRRDSSMVGLGVAVGTLPDLGHGFSAIGNLAVTLPNLGVIAAVGGRVLASHRPSVLDGAADVSGAGPKLRGVLAVIPSQEVSLSVVASFAFPESSSWKLVEATIPVEAVWPTGANASHWYVHLGTDPGRAPGPISARVLPGILPNDLVRAQAFVMVHGDGLAGLPIPTAQQGLVVAAGIDVAATISCLPFWAEVWARGMMALSTHPVFISGRAEVGGRLHLGPFSLGVSAGLDFQVGPGTTYSAALRICGEIDLWLIEISGCVHITLGDDQRPVLDDAVSPVVLMRVSDQTGAADPAQSDAASGAAVPVCWPDGVVQVGFAPAPARPPGPGYGPPQQFGIGAGFDPSGVAGADPGYRAAYRLTDVRLERVDGGPVPWGLPATWQSKAGQDSVPGDGAATLALLTDNNALWAEHVPDGGASDPSNPPGARGDECRGDGPYARAGWALGQEAFRSSSATTPAGVVRWTVPPHPRGGPPSGLDSSVRVREVRTLLPARPPLDVVEAGPAGRGALALGEVALPGGVEPVTAGPSLPDLDVAVAGQLVLADVERHLDDEGPAVRTILELDDPLVGSALLALHSTLPLDDDAVTSPSASPTRWSKAEEWVVDGALVSWWKHPVAPGAPPITAIEVRHPRLPAQPTGRVEPTPGRWVVALLGVHGVTRTAENTAGTARGGKPWTHQTPLPPVTPPPGWKPPLAPGGYRVRVGWAADATLAGAVPKHTVGESTFPFSVAGEVPDRPPMAELMTSTKVFHPAMLVRHVLGHDPDGSMPWFTADPLGVVLARTAVGVGHAYGYDPTLVVNATDEVRPVPVSILDIVAETHSFLRDWERAALAAGVDPRCALPHGPVRIRGEAGLKPERAYDLSLAFHRGHAPPASDAILAPVAFRTSAWSDPAALFRSVGFGGTPSAAALVSRVVLAEPLKPGEDGSDRAIPAALGATAVPPLEWKAGLALLLRPGATGMVVAGVLLRCVEPLLRGPALDAIALSADGSPAWQRVADRTGGTLLFVAPPGSTPSRLRLSWTRWGAEQSADLDVVQPADDRILAALAGGTS